MRTRRNILRLGFTMLELQVALLLLAFGVVTLSTLMLTQTRVMNRARGDYKPDSHLYLTQSPDPWVLRLAAPARITTSAISLATPTAPDSPEYSVSIVTSTNDLNEESITVVADQTFIP